MVQIRLRGMAYSKNLCLYAVVVFTMSLIMGPARGEDHPMQSQIAVKREIGEDAIKISNLAPQSPTLEGAILRRSPAPVPPRNCPPHRRPGESNDPDTGFRRKSSP
ncbi:hypothetical protein PSTT_05610 [Puccinia striiformis]|uniref:Uncharacterized protein n=1 Tax=Puccinia striiformis TaxID=27350 RepID=A0A2S4VNE7_9BASI|nr:hypothetical protein PSTT_05610 [Puccinia striiformis]